MSDLGTAIRRSGVALVVTLAMVTGMAMFAGAATAAPAADQGAVVAKSAAGKMTSTITGRTAAGDVVTGKFTPIKAVKKDGKLAMRGFIQGVITNDAGKRTKFSGIRAIPVKRINGRSVAGATSMRGAAACDVLRLVLGPLDLNILGLRVELNRVVLNITAIPGGGLLGDLLCAVANLLSGGPLAGLLGQLRTLLNRILGQLNLGV